MFFIKSRLTKLFPCYSLDSYSSVGLYDLYQMVCINFQLFGNYVVLMPEQISWPLFFYLLRTKTTLKHVHTSWGNKLIWTGKPVREKNSLPGCTLLSSSYLNLPFENTGFYIWEQLYDHFELQHFHVFFMWPKRFISQRKAIERW